jgi:hypothetical protein
MIETKPTTQPKSASDESRDDRICTCDGSHLCVPTTGLGPDRIVDPREFILQGNLRPTARDIVQRRLWRARRRPPGTCASSNARRPNRDYSFPGYADVLRLLLDRLAIAEVHILGWSLGGHIGLELPATEKRVRSLMITETPPVKPGPNVVKEAFLEFTRNGTDRKARTHTQRSPHLRT